VVTGLGVVSPLGIGLEEHWASLIAGRSAISRSRRLADHGFPADVAAEISEPTIRAHLSRLPRKQLKLLSRVMLFGMLGSSLAVEDGGLQNGSFESTRCGVFLGTFFTALDIPPFLHWMAETESSDTAGTLDLGKANAYCMSSINPVDYSLKTMPNLAAGHIAIAHNAQGFCRVIADGCIAGLQAIGQAYWAIKEDHLDVALCGGAEAPLEEFILVNFCVTDMLAQGVEEPESACCPFDAARRGTVLGEGAAILVLEEYRHALTRGAKIYGEVLGFGSSAGDPTISHGPLKFKAVTERVSLAMASALAEARRDSVDLIAANGDSTKANDLAEAQAIKGLFGPTASKIPVTATKAMHGHLVSGSGSLETINALLALNRDVIPPTLNLRNPESGCDLDYVPQRARETKGMKVALVNSVGLFGESAALVVGRMDES
jgi:3-oxoacyl-[acyl-carrier-protein] synthase II